jgi:xylulokinase
VAFGLRDSFEIMRQIRLPIVQVRASGGGARSVLWRQIQTDVTNLPHVTINVDEGPALGVALLAGVGTGLYRSVPEACDAAIRVVGSTQVCNVNRVAYDRVYDVYRSLYPRLREQFAEVGRLVS